MADPCFQGKTYGIWKLSDLGANTTNEFVALFLFGDVYKEHWKTTEGSVVALLNASILPAKEVSNWTHTFNRPCRFNDQNSLLAPRLGCIKQKIRL